MSVRFWRGQESRNNHNKGKSEKMNCPIHRSRELSEKLYCADCMKSWTKEILDFFEPRYKDLESDCERKIEKAKQRLKDDVNALVGYCVRWRDGEIK